MISLDDIATPESPAGGGAAAAMQVAISAALLEKVCLLGRLDAARARALRRSALELADADAAAYAPVRAAYALPSGGARDAAIREGLRRAIEVPLRIAEAARRAVELCEAVRGDVSRGKLADVEVAAACARAAADGAEALVRSNRELLRRVAQ